MLGIVASATRLSASETQTLLHLPSVPTREHDQSILLLTNRTHDVHKDDVQGARYVTHATKLTR